MSGKLEVIQNFEFRGLSLSTKSLVKFANVERCETELEHMLGNDKICSIKPTTTNVLMLSASVCTTSSDDF